MGIAVFVMIVAVIVILGRLGGWIAEQKGRRHREGMLLGVFLGIFGLFIELLLPNRTVL